MKWNQKKDIKVRVDLLHPTGNHCQLAVDTNGLNEAIKGMDPQNILKLSKKGKPLMMFVGVRGTPDQAYTEQVSGRWMQSLQNAHLTVQRYIVAPDRVMFMVEDGSLAWDVKDYLTTLTECTTVSFEQLSFDCKDNRKNEL